MQCRRRPLRQPDRSRGLRCDVFVSRQPPDVFQRDLHAGRGLCACDPAMQEWLLMRSGAALSLSVLPLWISAISSGMTYSRPTPA